MSVLKFLRLTTEKILFGSHPLAMPLQKATQRILRGPKDATFQLKHGPAAGCLFACETSCKYFFVREDYEQELLKTIMQSVHQGSVVFDIGAHYGYWTIIFSRLCGPGGKVFAFEPSPKNLARLSHNIEINHICNVEIVPFAISDRSKVCCISDNGSMSSVGTGSTEIPAIAIDGFCKTHPVPDLMLIDVEGHATEVLRGAREILSRGSVRIVCEIHDEREAEAFKAAASLSGSVTKMLGGRHTSRINRNH